METFYFLSGVCAVVILMAVVGTFVNYRTIGRLRNDLQDAYDAIDHLANDLSYDIGRVEDELGRKEDSLTDYIDSLNNNVHAEMEQIYRHIDSRVDKLTDGVSKQIADIYTECGCLNNDKSNRVQK